MTIPGTIHLYHGSRGWWWVHVCFSGAERARSDGWFQTRDECEVDADRTGVKRDRFMLAIGVDDTMNT